MWESKNKESNPARSDDFPGMILIVGSATPALVIYNVEIAVGYEVTCTVSIPSFLFSVKNNFSAYYLSPQPVFAGLTIGPADIGAFGGSVGGLREISA